MSETPADRDELSGEVANPEKLALQSKKLQKLRKAYEKRGIVYVSRIPPHMVRLFTQLLTSLQCLDPDSYAPLIQKPQKLRQLLEQYGSIGRLYCAPEGGHPQNLHLPPVFPQSTSL